MEKGLLWTFFCRKSVENIEMYYFMQKSGGAAQASTSMGHGAMPPNEKFNMVLPPPTELLSWRFT